MSQVPMSTVQLSVTHDHPLGDKALMVSLRTPAYTDWPSLPYLYVPCGITIPSLRATLWFPLLSLHSPKPEYSLIVPRSESTPRWRTLYSSAFIAHFLFRLALLDVLRAAGMDEGLG